MKKNYDFISGKSKIKARMIETSDDTISELKDRICAFKNQEVSEPLFVIVGSENVFLGKIKRITKGRENGKEVWHIETNMGGYKFEILNRSLINIINNKDAIEHLSELLHKACDDIIDNFVADIFMKDEYNINNKNIDDSKIEDIEIPSFLKRRK